MSEIANETRLTPLGETPVTGYELAALQEHFRLSLMDTTYIFGMYPARYLDSVKPQNQHEQIRSVTRALMVRAFYELSATGRPYPISRRVYATPLPLPAVVPLETLLKTILERADEIQRDYFMYRLKLNESNISIFLGQRPGAQQRRAAGINPHPIVVRFAAFLYSDILRRGRTAINDHLTRLRHEAVTRGHLTIDSVFESNGQWCPQEEKPRPTRGRKKSGDPDDF